MIITNRKREGYLIELETSFDALALALRGRKANLIDIKDSIIARKFITAAALTKATNERSMINVFDLKLALENIKEVLKKIEGLN